jgi:large subunit ribosomal protein L28
MPPKFEGRASGRSAGSIHVRGEIMAKCDLCGKGPTFGHNVSHSNVRTNRQWKANIQKVTIIKDGKPQRLNLCTRCLRTIHKLQS